MQIDRHHHSRSLGSWLRRAALAGIACVFAVPAAAVELPVLTDAELACQKVTISAGVTYVRRVFGARNDCFLAHVTAPAPSSLDCFASLDDGGTGDATTDATLDAAISQLSSDLSQRCVGLDFDNLGFPGFCRNELDGPYTSLDHEVCIQQASDAVVERLLAIEHPDAPVLPVSSVDAGCGDTIATKSSRMFINEVDTRTGCQMKQLEEKITLEVDCRAENDRADPATGDQPTDIDILAAHAKVLREIANACGRTMLDALGFPGQCTEASGVEFAVADVVECMFQTHHDEIIRYMDVLTPTTTKCGNAVIDFTETCDDGDILWEFGEYCRGNCSVISLCGDINDDGRITATDSLFVLQAAVGLQACSLEICDVNGDGKISATDAAILLQAAVGLPVAVFCPDPPPLTCGNGTLEEDETCDDGDTAWVTGQYCNGSCRALLCGDPDDSGTVTAADSRYMLLAALSLATCDLAVCDVDSNGAISSTDVLKVLAFSTGQDVELNCPLP